MVQKPVRENDGKVLLIAHLKRLGAPGIFLPQPPVLIGPSTDLASLVSTSPWLLSRRLVVKPDHLIKRRGKLGLIKLDATWAEASEWIEARRGGEVSIGSVSGQLTHFLVEPFVPHDDHDEMYLAMQTFRDGDEFLFYHQGGVDVGDVDQKARRFRVGVNRRISSGEAIANLLIDVENEENRNLLARYIELLHQAFCGCMSSFVSLKFLVFR